MLLAHRIPEIYTTGFVVYGPMFSNGKQLVC